MEPKFLRDSAIHFKEHMERNYPHKDIGEYTHLINSLDTFIRYGVWPDVDKEIIISNPDDSFSGMGSVP